MADLPISGLPAITVPSNSYSVAAVSASVTTQMTLAQVAAAISSSFTASQAISASYATSASYEINYETSSSYADTAVSASYALSASYAPGSISASYALSASYAISASYAPSSVTASFALTASYTVSASYAPDTTFPYTGSAQITGSLGVTGSVAATTLYAGVNGFTLGNGNNNGISNIAIGRLSLDSNTIGANNLAVGNITLNANTSGNDNVAVGQNAMVTNTTGYENTAVGFQSLLSVSTGNNNTAVGANALQVATGQNNTAIGNRAGFYLTSGNNNTFIGKYIGTFGMPAMNNTIIIADGEGNIGYKYSALRAEITGSLNVSGSISQTNVTSSLVKANANGILIAAVGGQDYTPTAYLSAYHTASLSALVENTPLTMSYSTTDFSYGGITISGSYSDKIRIDNAGVYNIQFSAQTSKTSGTSTTFYIWLAKNGVEVPSTNTGVTLAGGANDVSIPAWNFYVSASAGDYYQLMFAVTHNNGVIQYLPSGSVGLIGPAVPSVILTVNRIA